MAWIGFNTFGYDLERGIDVLQDSLKTALNALEEKRRETDKEYDDYEAGVAAGTIEPEGEWEDGVRIWEKSQFYDLDMEMIAETVEAVRKAHVMGLYHHWERTIARWARREDLISAAVAKPNHGHLRTALLGAGIVPHQRLDAIRDLNNALKHNSNDFGAKLMKSWPELLPPKLQGSPSTDWYQIITVTDADVRQIADALKQSGPSAFLQKNRFLEGLSAPDST